MDSNVKTMYTEGLKIGGFCQVIDAPLLSIQYKTQEYSFFIFRQAQTIPPEFWLDWRALVKDQ